MGRTIHLSGFPSHVTAEEVTAFLEGHTGIGTVYALKIRPVKKQRSDNKTFAYAVVQFTTDKSAELITSLVNGCLKYGGSLLKVWDVKRNIVLEQKPSILTLKHTRLHFGCLVSGDQLSVLYKGKDVVVNFGFELLKIYFFLSYDGVEYKLELSYEDIRKIQLGCPNHRARYKYLLIQVFGVPRIYKRPIGSLGLIYDPILNYFKDALDYQWDRTTDFTHSCCIGQSSAMCLEIPYNCAVPDFKKYYVDYEDDKGQFILNAGSSFSKNLDLVPIVGPPDLPEFHRFPFEILFKVCSLVQNGCLAGPTLNANFFKLVHPSFVPINYIDHALEKLYHLKECCYEPVGWLSEQYGRYHRSDLIPRSPTISSNAGLVYVRRVQITPSKVYFWGPELNVSNHVLRNYPNYIDNFIRVAFVDENLDKMRSTDLSPRTLCGSEERHTGIYKRILSTLRNGIVIGEKQFDFLAFSSSQLRGSTSTWMFAKTDDGLTAAGIRAWMGDFRKIRNVAKYAARLGQSFSSSKETLKIYKHEVEIIPDIELETGRMKYVFSDGIGKISADFARKVAMKCDLKSSTPSAFQIRYGGYKGVVAVDPTSEIKLSLRKSMCKYESENTMLDVLAWTKYQPCFLNRELITLLSTLGVKDHIFQEKQKQAVDELDAILTNPFRAQEVLELIFPGANSNALKEMLMCGYKPSAEPFLSMMLQALRAARLQELRTKTRIFVQYGRSLMGCLDETQTLEYGQVFVQVSTMGHKQFPDNSFFLPNESDKQKFIANGKVVVAKNPCLHPGDVRVLQAIDVAALHHMVDCIVFPQKGSRPHPDECSGSDLDGDIYFVSWDPALIPPYQIPPMEYLAAPPISQDHDVTIEEVEEYFTNSILNASLGNIANAHKVFADKEPNKAENNKCIELARLHSIAVDFPKTGVPAEIPDHLRIKEYPDFMEKIDKPTYESPGVIGKLFRDIKDKSSQTSFTRFTREVAMRSYDPDMEVDGFKDYIHDAYHYKGVYDSKLGNLMDCYGIKTEAEVISGSITKMEKRFMKKWDAEAIRLAVKSLKEEARRWFDEGLGPDSSPAEVYAKASAWYHVTYHPDFWGCYSEGNNRDHFLSFPWCIYDKLIKVKREKQHQKSTSFIVNGTSICRWLQSQLIRFIIFLVLLMLLYVLF